MLHSIILHFRVNMTLKDILALEDGKIQIWYSLWHAFLIEIICICKGEDPLYLFMLSDQKPGEMS